MLSDRTKNRKSLPMSTIDLMFRKDQIVRNLGLPSARFKTKSLCNKSNDQWKPLWLFSADSSASISIIGSMLQSKRKPFLTVSSKCDWLNYSGVSSRKLLTCGEWIDQQWLLICKWWSLRASKQRTKKSKSPSERMQSRSKQRIEVARAWVPNTFASSSSVPTSETWRPI